MPVGAHAVFLDAKRFLPHIPQHEFPAQALAGALYLVGQVHVGVDATRNRQADELEAIVGFVAVLARDNPALHRADAADDVFRRRELIGGLRMTYEPAHLRFFQARFELLAPFLEPVSAWAAVAGR